MNYALIFAGGVGRRMNLGSKPKQFLRVQGKEILVHTMEHFQNCAAIDGIILVCVADYIDFARKLMRKYHLTKVLDVIPGGASGQESIFNGLEYLHSISQAADDIVLIHDGVRPLIDESTIQDNLACVRAHGNAVTVAGAIETVLYVDDNQQVSNIMDRSHCYLGRAPQGFYLRDIYQAHIQARAENKSDNFIDSITLMRHYGSTAHVVPGPIDNIKVTTAMDFCMFQSLLKLKSHKKIKE